MKLPVTILVIGMSTVGLADIATFDDLTEGFSQTVVDGGITFYDYDSRESDNPPPNYFAIDDETGSFSVSGFSGPNVLNFNVYSVGPGGGLGHIGEFWMTNGEVSTSASLDFFTLGNGNSVSLEAYMNGAVVGSTTITPVLSNSRVHYSLSLSGVSFDSLRFTVSGPNAEESINGVVDNVRISAVPEPMTILVLGVGATCLARRGNRNNRRARKTVP